MINPENRSIVAKFGGSSMGDSERVKRVADIVAEDSMRRFVVVSAPGKIRPGDQKITDLLLECNRLVEAGLSFDPAFEQVSSRYEEIGSGLSIHSSVVGWLDSAYQGIQKNNGRDWIASRGEWLMANTLASFMEGSFVDAANLIRLQENGQVDLLTYRIISEQLKNSSGLQVIPGFYGVDRIGAVKTFERGGSDITGAIIARGIGANKYENWTDVDGLKAADPRVVFDPKTIPNITYVEMREMGYRGAEVLQKDTIRVVYEVGIPIQIRNSQNPSHPGTLIVSERERLSGESVIGIAGSGGFTSYQIEKFGMNEELGIVGNVLDAFGRHSVQFEHNPTGLDSMSIIVSEKDMKKDGEDIEAEIVSAIREKVDPDNISIMRDLALVCVVGQGIASAATEDFYRVSGAFKNAGININTVIYRTGGNSIVFGIDQRHLSAAIQNLYNTFIQ